MAEQKLGEPQLGKLPILSNKQFADGRVFVSFGNSNEATVPFSFTILKPGESLIYSLISSATADWLRRRSNNSSLQPQQDPFVAVVNLSSSRDTRILDFNRRTVILDPSAMKPYEKIEGSYEEVADGGRDKVPDTATILAQKSLVKEAISILARKEIDADNAAQLCDLPQGGKIFVVPVTEEMVANSQIAGDLNSQNKNLQTAKILLRKEELLIAFVDHTDDIHFITPGWGKAKTKADNLSSWNIDGGISFGQLIDDTIPDIVRKGKESDRETARTVRTSDRERMARHFVLKLITDAVDIFPPGVTFQLPAAYEAALDFHNRTQDYPPSLLEYVKDNVLPAAFENQLQKMGDAVTIDHLNGLPETVIEWVLNLKEEDRTRELASYLAMTEDMPRAVAQATRQTGLAYLGEENSRELLENIYLKMKKFLSGYSWQEIQSMVRSPSADEPRPPVRNANLKSKAASTVKNLDQRSKNADTKREELVKSLATERFDQIVSRVGLDHFDEALLTTSSTLDYQTVFRVAEMSPRARLVYEVLKDLPRTLIGTSQIRAVTDRNLESLSISDDGVVTLGLELCPLYENINGKTISEHGKPAPIATGTERDILDSMVGGKWEATKAVIQKLSVALHKEGLSLNVRALFGDIGVIVTQPDFAVPQVLRDERDLYEKLLGEHCRYCNARLSFIAFSDLVQDQSHPLVPQFCVASERDVVSPPEELNGYLELAAISSAFQAGQLTDRRAKEIMTILSDRLKNSKFNSAVYRSLVQTYAYLIQEGMIGILRGAEEKLPAPTFRLGMEIAENFLALTFIVPDFVQTTMPSLNVLVQKPT